MKEKRGFSGCVDSKEARYLGEEKDDKGGEG